MIIYLAADSYGRQIYPKVFFKAFKLESYFYIGKDPLQTSWIRHWDKFMLDSGAFSFITGKASKKTDIDMFTEGYIDYIKEHGIDYFFEMDVDKVYGYEKVKQLRKKIEAKVGKPSIPVFHMSRGLNEWKAMVKDYKYISLGIAGKDVGWGDYKTFYRFVMDARNEGTKVHGLGITGMKSLRHVPFHSVDSSSWTTGGRFRMVYQFNGQELLSLNVPENKRISKQYELAYHNFKEWNKFSKYMEHRIVL